MTNPHFKNPYVGVRKTTSRSDILRLSIDVPRTEVRLIRSVLIDYGSLALAETLLIKHLYNYINDNKLDIRDHDELIDHICTILDAGRTEAGPPQDSSRTNVRRRAGQVHSGGKK